MGLARKQRKAFYAKYANASLEQMATPIYVLCCRWKWPLSDWEKQFEAEALEYYRGQPLFHGGVPGLSVGERLLPGTVTGMNRWNDPDWKRCRVYTTPMRSKAEGYAEGIGGTVYRVALEGTIGMDILDVRALVLILGSPQMKRFQRVYGDRAQPFVFANMPFTLTADSATILEVLS